MIARPKTLSYSENRIVSTTKDCSLLPNKPLPISNIYAQSITLWRALLEKILLLSFICTLLPILTTQYALAIFNSSAWLHSQGPFHNTETVLVSLLNLIVSMGCYAALLLKTNSLVRNQPLSAFTLISKVLIKIPILIVAFILSSISVLLGSIAFIVPGFYILGMIFIFYPVVILYTNNPIKDFQKSYQLINHHWWHTFFTFIFPILLISIVSTAVALLLTLLLTPITNIYINLTIQLVGQAFIMCFFAPWICIQALLILNDLQLRKEGLIE